MSDFNRSLVRLWVRQGCPTSLSRRSGALSNRETADRKRPYSRGQAADAQKASVSTCDLRMMLIPAAHMCLDSEDTFQRRDQGSQMSGMHGRGSSKDLLKKWVYPIDKPNAVLYLKLAKDVASHVLPLEHVWPRHIYVAFAQDGFKAVIRPVLNCPGLNVKASSMASRWRVKSIWYTGWARRRCPVLWKASSSA